MNRILIFTFALIFICEGLGDWGMKVLKIRQRGYGAPLGFAILLGTLQLTYYPAQLFNLSFKWIVVVSTILLLFALLVTIKDIKQVVKNLIRPSTLIVLVSFVIFFTVLKASSIDMEYSDSATYLNYISFNINAPKLNLYDLTTGVRGEEWSVLYLFQGYYHFISYVCYVINIPYYLLGSTFEVPNMVIATYGFGILYQVLSTMFIVNIVESFHLKNRWFAFALLVFMLFYSNFAYWDISFAFYGNTFRNLFIMETISIIYYWFKEDDEQIKYLSIFTVMAGLASSSSFLFMSFAVLYSTAAFLFHSKKFRSLFDMTTLIGPLVFYSCAYISRSHTALSASIFVIYLIYLVARYKKPVRRLITRLEDFFIDHAILIFFILIPGIFAIGTLYLNICKTNGFNNYAFYFGDFVHLDMVKDYIFIHSNWLDNILNVLRWISVVMVIATAKKKEDLFMKDFMIMMLIFFLNPLCTSMLLNTVAGIVFYRNFMTLFNPFTEIVLFVYFYKLCEWNVIGQWILEIALCATTVISNYASFHENELGQYYVYIKNGKDLDPIYKVDLDEREALLTLRSAIREKGIEQPIIVSQSASTLTYIPEGYQLFGPRNHYYESIDNDFYNLAKRHYDWDEKEDLDYSKTCSYVKKYDVDYILVQYWENSEFDVATDGCAVTIYTGSKYKVKEVQN